jgi:hypothetical protein
MLEQPFLERDHSPSLDVTDQLRRLEKRPGSLKSLLPNANVEDYAFFSKLSVQIDAKLARIFQKLAVESCIKKND